MFRKKSTSRKNKKKLKKIALGFRRGGAAAPAGQPPPEPPIPSVGKEDRMRRENRANSLGKGKREKDNERMREFFPHSLYIGSRYPMRVGAWFCRALSPPVYLDRDLRAPDALSLDQM